MTKIKLSDTEQVTAYIKQIHISIQPAVAYLRQAILAIDAEISEQIKWNSPAFYYSGKMKLFDPKAYKRDIIVMNLRGDKIMCVLPTGTSIKTNIEILEGDFKDGRRIINFKDLDDIKEKEEKLRVAILEWLTLVER